MSLKKELLCLLCLLIALGLFCRLTVPVLTPKRYDLGAVWGMYLQEPEDSVDALFFGSSLAYCDVTPAVIYEESGAASFVMGGPEQTFPITYRYLREACKTQSPQTVFIEASGLLFGRRSRSTKVNLTYMPWSMERLIPTFEEILTVAEATPEETEQKERETRIGLLVPLYAYHDRWDQLGWQDVKEGLLGYETDPLAGYTFLDQVRPADGFQHRKLGEDLENYERNLEYAGKMVEFCKEKGIRPVFYLTPAVKSPDAETAARFREDLEGVGAELVDFNEEFEAIGLDMSMDFKDTQHLNYRGAEKFSRYLAGRLSEWGVTPSGKADPALWQERVEYFADLREKADAAPVKYDYSKDG